MKRKLITLILLSVCIVTISACSKEEKENTKNENQNGLVIKQDYDFSISTLPFSKKIKEGDEIIIEFHIEREGFYKDAAYFFRYFQTDGKGWLIDKDGQMVNGSNYSTTEGKSNASEFPKDELFVLNTLDTALIRKEFTGTGSINPVYPKQSLMWEKITELKYGNKIFAMNTFYRIPSDNFTFIYKSGCKERQTLDFVFEDNFGKQVLYQIKLENDSK